MITAAVVGSGLIARKKHLPAWKNIGGRAKLVAICDVNRDSAVDAASQFGIEGVYTDFEEMLQSEDLDMVDICTPPKTHTVLARKSLHTDCSVLVEKPMAVDVAGCDKMIASAKRSSAKLSVAHSDLFYPAFIEARRMVETGELGTFRGMRIFLSTPSSYITAKENHWAHDLPGGVIGETGPHVVYMSLPFIGRVENIGVAGRKILREYPWSPYEDYRVQLEGERGTSSVVLTYASDQWAAEVEIWGSHGRVRADLESQVLVKYNRSELTRMSVGMSAVSAGLQTLYSTWGSVAQSLFGGKKSTHEVLIEQMVRAVEGSGEVPVPAADGRETVRVMDEIGRCLAEGD